MENLGKLGKNRWNTWEKQMENLEKVMKNDGKLGKNRWNTWEKQMENLELDDGWPESVEEQGLLLLVWRHHITKQYIKDVL